MIKLMGKAAVRSCEEQTLFFRQFNEYLVTEEMFLNPPD